MVQECEALVFPIPFSYYFKRVSNVIVYQFGFFEMRFIF